MYSCLNEKSDEIKRLDLAKSLEDDLKRVSNWGNLWQVSLNSGKTKIISINRYKQSNTHHIAMSGDDLEESNSFRLVGLTISIDLTCNEYICSIAKKAAMKVGSLFRARRYLSPECILHLYKSLIRPCMEYCCHIWAGASSTSLALLDRIQLGSHSLDPPPRQGQKAADHLLEGQACGDAGLVVDEPRVFTSQPPKQLSEITDG